MTLSFWIKSSVAQDFKGYLRSRDGTNYEYPFATGSLSADTWTKVTKTIPGNSNIQIDNDNEAGFEINLFPFLGTDRTDGSVTEDAWATYNSSARTRDNTSTWYTTNDATLEITGVQLEVGDTATSFEHRSHVDELARCSRYCQVWARGYCIGNAVGSNDINIGVPLTTPLRTIPSCNGLQMHRSGNQSTTASFHSAQYTANSTVVEIRMGGWTGGAAVSDEVAYAVPPTNSETMKISAEL